MHFNIKALALTSSVIWGGALLFVGLANLVLCQNSALLK